MKRLFLAISTNLNLEPTPSQILKKLKKNSDQHNIDIRWTPPNNYHVTLVFLGETADEKLNDLREACSKVSENFPPFTIKISDVGSFPDELSSRVIWFGVQNSRSLRSLQEILSEKMKKLGFHIDDRPYSPHLTVGRLRNPHKTKDIISPFVRKKIAKINITEFVLFESVGSFPFPTYNSIFRFQLNGLLGGAQASE